MTKRRTKNCRIYDDSHFFAIDGSGKLVYNKL